MSLQNFEILNKIGEGAYSIVHKVRRKSDGMIYALKKVKFVSLNEKEKENAVNEIRILASISHPNIIGYKEAFIDENSNCLCLIIELAEGGDLLQKINKFQKQRSYFLEQDIWDMFIQTLRGLKALHDLNILHRDLKCANVYLSQDGVIKLGDMNVSKVAKLGLVYTQTGTPYYASPEVWKDKPYDSKSDIWSLGCVLYEAATLRPPFQATDMQGLYKKVISGDYPSIPSRYSNDLANVIAMMLRVDSRKRPSCEELLSNPLILKNCNNVEPVPSENNLLKTIKVPKNIGALATSLPGSNYSTNKISSKYPDVFRGPKQRMLSEQHLRPNNENNSLTNAAKRQEKCNF
jgi:NIMA (never in mitosis gene a)-related kinase 1/4/5